MLDVEGEDALTAAGARAVRGDRATGTPRSSSSGGYYPSAGFSDEYVHLFWARAEAEPTGPGGRYRGRPEPFDRMVDAARAGRVRDAKTALALLMAAGRPPLPRRDGAPPSAVEYACRGGAGDASDRARRAPGVNVGIPKEVKDNEFRVAATPEGVRELTARGTPGPRRGRGRAWARRSTTRQFVAAGRRDPARRRRGVRRGRHDREGQGAAARGVRAVPRGPDPVHVPAPGRRRGAHAVPRRAARCRRSPTRPCSRPTAGSRCSRRCRRSPAAWRRRWAPRAWSGPRGAGAC